ncbi:hypothetical protein D3C77_425190 [compost metagenome]
MTQDKQNACIYSMQQQHYAYDNLHHFRQQPLAHHCGHSTELDGLHDSPHAVNMEVGYMENNIDLSFLGLKVDQIGNVPGFILLFHLTWLSHLAIPLTVNIQS